MFQGPSHSLCLSGWSYKTDAPILRPIKSAILTTEWELTTNKTNRGEFLIVKPVKTQSEFVNIRQLVS